MSDSEIDDWETVSSQSQDDDVDMDEVVHEEKEEEDFENLLNFWFPGQKSPSFRYPLHPPKTLLEQKYVMYMSEILSKPKWWEKLADKTIVEKWRAELPNPDFSVDFLLEELQYICKEWMRSLDGGGQGKMFWPLPARGVYLCDNIIDDDLKTQFTSQILVAEQDALRRRRWHPQSEGKVLDIFHPSNFPVVYGKTRYSVTPHALFGEHVLKLPLQSKARARRGEDVSKRYQWLPAEFYVNENGDVHINSYINNLSRRQYPELYGSIAKIFGSMLPMFEAAMGSLGKPSAIRIHYDSSMTQSMDDFIEERWIDHIEKSLEDRKAFIESIRPEWADEVEDTEDWMPEDDEKDMFQDYYYELFDENSLDDQLRIDIPNLPATFTEFLDRNKEELSDDTYNLRNRSLQVIVKAATIFLTPDSPEYKGGDWHLEGTENENIAATGIYYYDIENIKDSMVQFREIFDETDLSYEQSEFHGIETVFGITSESSLNVQPAGYARSAPGRCLVFCNGSQHRVPSFELADNTRPGSRRMWTDWMVDEVWEALGERVPEVCAREIVRATRWVLEERSAVGQGDNVAKIYQISLCEH
ncbi:hypothetical protein BC829DRAFT_395137 [Chytridium lagenaria]|nr:hypothetical protein BC829DRAFT_395137 [Chytridium lagenaria]